MRKRTLIILLATALLGGIAAYLFSTRGVTRVLMYGPFVDPLLPYSDAAYQNTRARATALVAALETYKGDHGEYPGSLQELTPALMTRVDPPLVGTGRWKYRRPAKDHCVLAFLVGPTYENDTYDSAKQAWHVDR